jgi:hypothetical protein
VPRKATPKESIFVESSGESMTRDENIKSLSGASRPGLVGLERLGTLPPRVSKRLTKSKRLTFAQNILAMQASVI